MGWNRIDVVLAGTSQLRETGNGRCAFQKIPLIIWRRRETRFRLLCAKLADHFDLPPRRRLPSPFNLHAARVSPRVHREAVAFRGALAGAAQQANAKSARVETTAAPACGGNPRVS